MAISRLGFQIPYVGEIQFNQLESSRFEFVRQTLGLDTAQTVCFLVRAALTWFPSNWVASLTLVKELRDDCQGIDWMDHDERPF